MFLHECIFIFPIPPTLMVFYVLAPPYYMGEFFSMTHTDTFSIATKLIMNKYIIWFTEPKRVLDSKKILKNHF